MAHSVTSTINGKVITAEEFYTQTRKWAAIVRNVAKANASRFSKGKTKQSHTYKTGNKAGKSEQKLRNSIRYSIARDSGVPENVSFKIPIHGIFREWAVGYGQPRVVGKYVSPNSRVKRTMEDWVDKPIERNTQKIFNLAVEFYGDLVVISSFGAKRC
ncbi:MAG: hypothetical protein FWC34_06240 [Bacteroidetes bacterium]|nr:hypothetical protein [Bacteroidota bacterium]MCL2303332.1 hypothetical protein [Lentimicrobiaceae bacterium]